MKSLVTIFTLIALCLPLGAQDLSSFRQKEVTIIYDTLRPDSLMILPGSLFLFSREGHQISDSLYRLDLAGKAIVVDPSLHGTTLSLQYRVISLNLRTPYFHKDAVNLQQRSQNPEDPFRITSQDLSSTSYYGYSEMNKQGSLSRGVTFGNNQDVVVNSNLNLQVTGKLSDDLNIVAAISDNNIPIQPDGYSQQISEFDRVYIELFNEQVRLIAGDFELEGSPGEFMNFYKRAKGAVFKGNFDLAEDKERNLTTTISGAVSKGKYSRNAFTGKEGNQGPYRLLGSNHEQFIIVLAGSERVFIDGKLLTRGLNNDYVIDYNSAEVTFTPAQPITKDKRIIIEFEYSERSYARFLLYTSNEISTKRGKLWINAFSEQDDKNQTLQQDLSEDDKILMTQIGNDIQSALVARTDSVGYDPDEVLYLKKDSLAGGILHHNIYVHSLHPDSAVYRLRFSFVGEGMGNYLPVNSATNGKIFRWEAPVNGVKQGAYEPVALLITPKKKQVFSIGGIQQLSDLTHASFELALTNNDPNTFSRLDANENLGVAFNVGLDQDLLRRDTSRMRFLGSVHYRHTSHNFDPVERFRSIEFSRDWNLEDVQSLDEHQASLGLRFFEEETGQIALQSEFLSRGRGFEGIRNNLNGNLRFKDFILDVDGSLMNSSASLQNTRFLRHRLSLARHFPFMVFGVREEGENNNWQTHDSLMGNSFAFQQYEVFLSRPDSAQNQAFITYKNRRDYLPKENSLKYTTLGQDLNIGLGLLKNPNNRLNAMLTLRDLTTQDTSLSAQKPERNVLGRIEHSLQLADGAISTSTFYELGSGLETRKDYSYLEVPPGQGIYKWIDYNQNGAKELDEFEIARFADEARFIRIFLPSGDYFTVYSNQFNQTIHLDPSRKWKTEEGFRKMASLFSDQFAYRVSRKSSIRDLEAQVNPFNNVLNNPALITFASSLRNNVSFNRSGQVFGANYIYQKNLNKNLLANGFDTRILESHGLRVKLNPGKGIAITDELDTGVKTYQSEFLGSRDYQIEFLANKVQLQYQLNLVFRLESEYGYKTQLNRTDLQKSQEHNLGAELRYSILEKGILTARMNYIHLDYNDDPGSPVAYEMLGSLLPGHNGTWTVLFQRSITGGIELNLEYAGRVSENQAMIHTGSMQVRANF